MAGTRIRTEFYTDQSNKYRVDVYDENYSGSVLTSFEQNGFELEYERTDTLLQPLIASTCIYKLIDDGSPSFSQFKTDIATAAENRFKLVIYKYDGATAFIYWAGVIMSDMVMWDNESYPRVFEIIAKDGLNRLEKIPFDKITAAPYSTTKVGSMIKIIFDCLSYAGTAQFWNGSTRAYINCNLAWRDTQQTSITQAKIAELINFGVEFLIDDPAYSENYDLVYLRPDTDKPLMALDVLKGVLKLFCVRLILADGTWRIQQLSLMGNTSVTVGKYDYTGNYTSSGTDTLKISTHPTILPVLSGGKFSYYPAIKSAKASVLPTALIKGEFSFENKINKDNKTATKTLQLGTLYGGTGLRLQINIIYNVDRWDYKAGKDYYIECKIKLTADNYRITNNKTTNIPNRGGDAKWTTTAADVYYKDIYYAVTWGKPIKNKDDLASIPTLDIPFTSKTGCTLELTVTLKSVSGTTTFPDTDSLQMMFKRVEVAMMDVAQTPPIYASVSELTIESPYVAQNSIEIDYGKLRITDNYGRTNTSSINTIMVAAPNDGSALVPCNIWNAGHTTNVGLIKTMLTEAIALQRYPVKKYMGNFRGYTYTAYNTINYDSIIWVFMGGRYIAKTEEWQGDWFGISYDASVITSNKEKKYAMIGRDINVNTNYKEYSPLDAYPVGGVAMNTIDTKIDEGDTVTSIGIEASDYSHIKAGDMLVVVNPNTLEKIQEFEVTADVEVNDTSIVVTSDTADEDIWQTSVVTFNPRELVVSQKVRAIDELQSYGSVTLRKNTENQTRNVVLFRTTTSTAATELTTDGAAGSGISNRIVVPDDTAIHCILILTAKKSNEVSALAYLRRFLIVNNSGTCNITGSVQTMGTDIEDAGLGGSSVTITAASDGSDDYIKVEVTCAVTEETTWTAQLLLTYATCA